ncbi:MAG: RluA family pseudouridine synthase [Lachnospiraceae bacterium]|nr:RluA family pseudouridine synthase [Lachnospiraceae bacterium]
MERKIKYITADEENGHTVKDILRHHFRLSARQISRAKFLAGGILVNGEEVTVRRLLNPGDVLTVTLEDKEAGSHQLLPQPGDLDIRYEDDDLLLVNKPAGLVVHPSPGHYADSLANILVWHYGQQDEHIVVRPVGRLDRETSGLIYIAKNKAAVRSMELQRTAGEMERHYLALVHGSPAQDEGIIDEPIGPDPDVWMKQRVTEDGAYAKTAYRVRERFDGYSLVELHLFTGRTHQIRVHMSWLGHPLLGDSMYGDATLTEENSRENLESGEFGMTRTALHSWRLVCTQPFSGERLEFTCELPEDMRRLVERE